MCFSPEVSFASGAVLTAIGAVTLKTNDNPNHKLLAAMPVMFGLQQIAEGFVWLQLRESATVGGTTAVLAFLGFALVIWPAFVPWACHQAETGFIRKKILLGMGLFGIGVGVSTFWLLATATPQAYVVGHSVGYRFATWTRDIPANIEFISYIVPALFPFFVSSQSWVRTTGTLIFGGMVLAMIVRHEAVTSVWCFFAAVVSSYVAFRTIRQKQSFDKKVPAF
jgi:hypothetical protein